MTVSNGLKKKCVNYKQNFPGFGAERSRDLGEENDVQQGVIPLGLDDNAYLWSKAEPSSAMKQRLEVSSLVTSHGITLETLPVTPGDKIKKSQWFAS